MIHDYPVQSASKDLFKRAEFADRIATLIINRDSPESVAFSINGAWGEGKTSVLNFICERLAKEYPNIVVIKFNPWRFADEPTLLRSFFFTVATDLKQSLSKAEMKQGMSRHERKSDFKKISRMLADYGDTIAAIQIPFVPTKFLGTVIKTTFTKFSTTELDSQKKELSVLLSKYKRKIVVVIDDIDRLSKDEIYSLFRLVKLTGDFHYFVYLLAYDEEMVADAIGDRFGHGGSLAGRHFLEKIVQVPIALPEATMPDLNLFFSQSFEKVLVDNKLTISEEDAGRFRKVFQNTLLFHLNTPRKIVRYCNALQFSLPMLYGEVNIVDLTLLEGIKAFYPKHFEFIKDNASVFTETSLQGTTGDYDQQRAILLKETLEVLKRDLTGKESAIINSLLIEIFPPVESLWNKKVYTASVVKSWTESKRAVSKNYFSRYFTYTLSKGDISDRAFEQFVKTLRNGGVNEGADKIVEFCQHYSVAELIYKLRLIEQNFSPEESHKIAKSIISVSDIIPNEGEFLPFVISSFSQATLLISQLVRNLRTEPDRLSLMQDLTTATNVPLAIEVYCSIKNQNGNFTLLSEDSINKLDRQLLDRCLQITGGRQFFLTFPSQTNDILRMWSKLEKEHLNNYLQLTFTNHPDLLPKFLLATVREVATIGEGKPRKDDLSQQAYEFLKSVVDVDMLAKLIEKHLPVDMREVVISTVNNGIEQTPENATKQFIFWHERVSP